MVLYIIQLFLVLTRCLGFISRFTVDFSERFTPAGYRGEEVWVRTFFHLISVIIQQRYPYPVSRKKDTNILPIQCNYSTIGDFSNTHVFKFTFTYTGNNLIQMFCSCGCIAFWESVKSKEKTEDLLYKKLFDRLIIQT